jgi:DNA-binding protein HU-beta
MQCEYKIRRRPELKKSELVERMAEREGMSKKYATTALDAMLASITDALKRGETVMLPGFGTFLVRNRSERQGRNPLTGEAVIMAARRVPVFKPGKTLKESVSSFSSANMTNVDKMV